MTDASLALEMLEAPFLALAVIFFRVSGLMLLLPGFGERMIPMRVRLAAAFTITLILAPLLPPEQMPEALTPAIILSEIAIGAAFGAVLRFLAHVLLMAGTIAAQATSLAQLFGAPSADPSSAIGTFLHIAGLALLMAGGFHLAVIELLGESWRLFPVGFVLPGQDLADWGVGRVSDAFRLAMLLAMPFILVSILYNLILGIINKAMPQLMVALVGAPAITGLSLVTLATTAVLILSVWRDHVARFLVDPFAS